MTTFHEVHLVEGSHDGGGVCYSGSFNKNTVEGVAPVEKSQQGFHQISSHRAAYTAVVHRHDVLRLVKVTYVRTRASVKLQHPPVTQNLEDNNVSP